MPEDTVLRGLFLFYLQLAFQESLAAPAMSSVAILDHDYSPRTKSVNKNAVDRVRKAG